MFPLEQNCSPDWSYLPSADPGAPVSPKPTPFQLFTLTQKEQLLKSPSSWQCQTWKVNSLHHCLKSQQQAKHLIPFQFLKSSFTSRKPGVLLPASLSAPWLPSCSLLTPLWPLIQWPRVQALKGLSSRTLFTRLLETLCTTQEPMLRAATELWITKPTCHPGTSTWIS